jgi:hypothetical protein
MLNNFIIPILIVIFSLLIIFYILNKKKNNIYENYVKKFDSDNIIEPDFKNNWIVLLTTCVQPKVKKNDETEYSNQEINDRKELYIKQINRWLNETNLQIVVVDSSEYKFKEINNNRLTVIDFNIDTTLNSSSQYEAISIIYALNKMEEMNILNNCTHILKVTGRYFLENIENILNNTEQDLDLYLQIHRNDDIKWQHTEYFGIKKDLLAPMLEPIINKGLMENNLYNYSLDYNYTKIGPFKNNIKRGGDNLLIENL